MRNTSRPRRLKNNRRKRGFVLITMAIAAVALIGALGLAFDVGRTFITKNETQAFCDAAAMAATLKLDGTFAGISNANTAVSNSTNYWNMDTAAVASPTVDFATSKDGPWSTNPSPATGYIYARVQSTVNLPIYFAPFVMNSGRLAQSVQASAVAGQIPITIFTRGLDPYTVISTQPNAPNFGLIVGNQYDIQWPAMNASGFVKPPCSDEPVASQNAVLNYWRSVTASHNGYWGASSNSVIYQEVLDDVQLTAISVGQNILPILTSGNKKAQATALDTRVQEDADPTDGNPSDGYSLSAYLANSSHNGRRFIALPVIDPTDIYTTTVLGYASLFLLSDGTASSSYYQSNSGNEPFCAVFAGAYIQGSASPGSGSGAYRVSLVQ